MQVHKQKINPITQKIQNKIIMSHISLQIQFYKNISFKRQIKAMSQCVLNMIPNLMSVIKMSGKGFEYLGQYDDCLANTKMNYNLVNIKMTGHQSDLGYIGLCLPRTCSKQLIEESINSLFTQIHYPFEVSSINNSLPDYQYQFSWAFYLCIVITILSLSLTIYATISSHCNKNNCKITSAFSLQQSRKTLSQYNHNSNLNVLNGVRSLAMMWVVIGHVYSELVGGTINISSSVEKNSFLKPFFLIIEAGLFSVDVFFFIGGLLIAYVMLKDTSSTSIKYPIAIFQRVLRFWPCYLFSVLIYYAIYLHLGSGPRWASDQQIVGYCDNMWKMVFFVDNFINDGNTPCMGWSWYLQNDVQLFIFSIVLLFIYKYKPIITKSFIWLTIIGSMVFTFVWTFNHGTFVITHFADVDKWGSFFNDVYIKPWARAPPYMLGLFFGILHSEYTLTKKEKQNESQASTKSSVVVRIYQRIEQIVQKKRLIRIAVQLFGIAVMLILVFIPRSLQVGYQWQQWQHSLYQSTGRFFFVLMLYLTLLPSLIGCKNSIIQFMMDTRLFNFLAKISFCTYLVHLTVVMIWVNSRSYNRYFTILPAFPQYGGLLLISLFIGFLMTVIIEIPCSKLQKHLIQTLLKNSSKISQEKAVTRTQTTVSDDNLRESLLTTSNDRIESLNQQHEGKEELP